MIQIRKSDERGHFDYGWLDTRHTFSFGKYMDPEHMGFRALRVINEDRVAPAEGFGEHPHRDMEIITYVLQGELAHADSMGHQEVLRPGDVQVMSAGTGITHSEFNASQRDDVRLVQIWIKPERYGITPRYDQRRVEVTPGKLTLLAGRNDEGVLPIFQDARVYALKLDAAQALTQKLEENRHAWVQVLEGALAVNGVVLKAGDGAAVSREAELKFSTPDGAHALVFDLV